MKYVGDNVKIKKNKQIGVVEYVDEVDAGDPKNVVYHVRLENDEVRHYTETELNASAASDE